MTWQKGKSGNQKGRPPKSRVLAQALRETGAFDSYGDLSNQQLLARMVWEGLAMGTVTFAGGRTLDLDGKEWLELVKWVHAHMDGSYQPEPEEPKELEEPEKPKAVALSWKPLTPAEKIAHIAQQQHEAEYRRLAEVARREARQAAPEDDQGDSMIATPNWN